MNWLVSSWMLLRSGVRTVKAPIRSSKMSHSSYIILRGLVVREINVIICRPKREILIYVSYLHRPTFLI